MSPLSRLDISRRNLSWFLLFGTLLAALSAWVLAHGFVNPEAAFRWATVMGIMGDEEFRLEHIGLIYPHAPYYLLLPFYHLPGLRDPAAPYLLSSILAALLLVIWNHHMRQAGIAHGTRLAFILLVALHPAFLWSASNGSHTALSLLMFYALYRACLRMLLDKDTRAFILLALVLALYFFVDEVASFIFLALIPLLALVAPRRMLLESPASVYGMILMPLAIVILAWFYLNWIFHGDAWTFLTNPSSSFRGAWQYAQQTPWLREYGGEFLGSLLVGALYILVSYPILTYFLWHLRGDSERMRAAFVLLMHPLIAIGFATGNHFLGHPMEIGALIIGGVMAELSLLDPAHARKNLGLIALLAASIAGGWFIHANAPTVPMRDWQQAILGQTLPDAHEADARLGRWLTDSAQPTLIDSASATHVILGMDETGNLILPFSNRHKIELRRRVPEAPQIALPDPDHVRSGADRINVRYPDAYRKGFPGYERVYDEGGWRVYRRTQP